MNPYRHLLLAGAAALTLGLAPGITHAQDSGLTTKLAEARQEGAILTAFALNRHLTPFTIEVAVVQGVATLAGKVENQVDKDLAEQLAAGTDGIDRVDNQLQIDPDVATDPGTKANLARHFDNATLTATVKSKLLWNSVTNGLNIEVEARDGVVTLKGQAKDADAKNIAGSLASNTDGVTDVNNLISVSARDTETIKAQAEAGSAREQLSDAWIVSKVKSSLIYSRNLDGLNIKVDSKEGMVSLNGVVASYAEKQLAVEIARNIRGVKGVDADNLRVVSTTTS